MDDSIEKELRRLADEQGRDLDEVVEMALRYYIVSEAFAAHDPTGPGADTTAAVPDADGDAVFDADAVFGRLPPRPSEVDDSCADGPLAEFDLDGFGDMPPAADSDTVIVGSAD
ncbi:MAG: hypothetical protein EBR86_04240 [Planctomycetia bacterium]|nr:hypothetical protein [Planctomycetia bacterium]